MAMRELLGREEALLAPGVFDPLSALLVQQAGFAGAYVSGASVSYSQLGRPDLGMATLTQIESTVSRIRDRVDIELIVDADTGFGNALNVIHTVRLLEKAGANAIQLEDQNLPKRCGHLAGKSLVSLEEMVGKVRAAVDTRKSEDTLIIARTDGIAVEGFERALERAHAYREAGADVLFVEAPSSLEQMKQIVENFGGSVPLLANMVEGGRTPILTVAELSEIGFSLVITPGSLVRAMAQAGALMLDSLLQHGTTAAFRDQMFNFDQLNQRLGLKEALATGVAYDGPAKTD